MNASSSQSASPPSPTALSASAEVERHALTRVEVDRTGGAVFSLWGRRVALALAIVAAIATLVSTLWGATFTSPRATPSDTYSAGPIGHHAFVKLLQELGYHVRINRGGGYEAIEAPVLFLEPGLEAHVHGLDLQLIDALRARWNQRLPTLVVLPKWELSYGFGQTVRHREFPVELGRLYSPTGFELAVGSQDQSTTSEGLALHVPELQLIANPPVNAEVLYDTSEGALLIRIGRTLILSDPDLLHSFNLHRGDHAQIMASIVDWFESDTILVDESFHGHGATYSLREALAQFPTILIIVQIVLLLLVLVSLGTLRFGPALPPRPTPRGPAASIEVAAGVLAHGQSTPLLVQDYVRAIIEDLHRSLGLSSRAGSDLQEMASAIDRAALARHLTPRMRAAWEQANEAAPSGRFARRHAALSRLPAEVFAFRAAILGHTERDVRR